MHASLGQAPPTCAATFVRLIVNVAVAQGIDREKLCRRAGLEPALLEDNDARIAQPQVNQLWLEAEELSGDPTIGLQVARRIGPEALRLWNYSMMLSDTLLSAYERAIRDLRLLGDGMRVELLPQGGYYAIRFSAMPGGCPGGLAFDAALGGIVVFSRWLIKDESFAPLRVEFAREPPLDKAPYEALFGCQVLFSQPENRLLLLHKELARPIPTGDEVLASLYDSYIGIAPANNENELVTRVRRTATALLTEGEPKLESVAAALHMSARTLRRRLQQEGIGYRELLEQQRKELCAAYLAEPDLALKEVAYRLGFTEPSSFHRAFKRWYGVAPGEYRNAVSSPEYESQGHSGS